MAHILAQDFNAITFQGVVDFCEQKIVEGTQLDYKQQIPKELAKHFAAMSNQRGGLIVIGVAEDARTGLPSKWEGIAYEDKLIDQIHQFAGNVRPLPSYDVRPTDEVGGKVFVLVRINEGDAPPYTVINDPTVYVRVGNTTSRFVPGPADVNVISDLFGKRARAEAARRDNLAEANARLRVLIRQHIPRDDKPQLRASNQITAYLQPFNPNHELALPRDIFAQLDRIRVTNNHERDFPGQQMSPVARGMLHFQRGAGNPSFSCDQVYANGMFFHAENIVRPGKLDGKEIYLVDIGQHLYKTLLFGRKLYSQFGYNGLTRGAVELNAPHGCIIRPMVLDDSRPQFRSDFPFTIDKSYTWPIEADTHQLGDDGWVHDYFYERMREIYWDLGFTDVERTVLDQFVAYHRFR